MSATSPAIVPRRGQHIRVGDVVKPTPDTAYRVERIAEVPGTIWYAGEWVDLTRPAARPQAFTVCFIRWYTVLEERAS